MERTSLTKRCVLVEPPNETFKEEELREYFPTFLSCALLQRASDSPQWLLLFNNEDDADNVARRKRITCRDNLDIMVHHCENSNDIPHNWLPPQVGPNTSLHDEGASSKPPEYQDIYPPQNDPNQPLNYPGHAGGHQPFQNQPYFSHPGGPLPSHPGWSHPGQASAHPGEPHSQPPPYNGHSPQTNVKDSASNPDLQRSTDSERSTGSNEHPQYPYGPHGMYGPPGPYGHPGHYQWPPQPPHMVSDEKWKPPEDGTGPFHLFPGYPYHPYYPYPPYPYPPGHHDPVTSQPMVYPGYQPPQGQNMGQRPPLEPKDQPPETVETPHGQQMDQTAFNRDSEDEEVTYQVERTSPVKSEIEENQPTSDFHRKSPKVVIEPEETSDQREMESPSLKMIRVFNLPPDATEDTVRYFFENKRKSGGGDIEDLDFDSDSNTAIITFEEDEVAERVISRLPLLLNKKNIDVEIFNPRPPSPEPQEETQGSEGEAANMTEFAIEVRGMKLTTSQDTILYYFESRKGANADVADIKFIEDKEIYMVWFEEESAIDTILKKQHKVEGQMLEVKRYIPPPPPKPVPKYENKFFITNINPATTKDGLENYLEAKAKVTPEEIIFGEEEGTALVTFEEPPDIEKLKTALMKRPLENCHLQIHTVAVSDCVVVTGFSETISSDTLEYYFDNERRSGVTGVKDVNLIQSEGKCLIYFEEPQSALDVCKRDHTVDGKKLTVQVYYESLGQAAVDDDGPKFKPLKPITIEGVNFRKIEFLLNSEINQAAFQKQIGSLYAEVTWPEKQSDFLEIRCTLNEDVKDCRKLAKTWAKSVTAEAKKFLDMLAVEDVETLQDAWDDVMKHLREINIPNPDGVALRIVRDEQKIVIFGYKSAVEDVKSKVKTIIQNVGEELERRKQNVTEDVPLKLFQILILLYIHFLDQLRQEFNDLQIHPNVRELKIIFSGMSSHVTTAKMKMYETLQNVVGVSAGKFSDGFIKFLNLPEVKSYIGKQMKMNRIIGVWDIQEGNVIKMYSLSDEGAVTAVKVLKDSVIEITIPLDAKQSSVLNQPEWNREIRRIEEEYSKAIVQINDEDPQNVVIYQTSAEDEGIVKEKVSDIFYKYAIQDVVIPLSMGQSRLIQEQFKRELDMVQESCSLKHTNFRIDNVRITVQGSSDGTSFAKSEFDNMIKSIHKKHHTINKAGIVKYIGGEQGRAKVSQVERKNKVVIEIDREDDQTEEDNEESYDSSPQSLKETATCTTPTGQVITTVVGDITELKVDVLVNAANKELKHVGGLAKAIVDKGGMGIQRECDEYVKKKSRLGKMYEGEIFCGSPGKLQCKMIAHAVGPVWQNGRHKEDEYLTECIQATLEEMDDKKYHSVAIPALCTGVFGYPVHKATKTIVESIRDYLKENGRDTKITKIYLCDMKEDTVDHFVSALEKLFDKANVQKQRGRTAAKRSAHGSNQYRPTPVPAPMSSAPPSHNITVTLVKGQIAMQEVDVIVNTTSNSLQLNQGAVSQSLLKLGGPGLQAECTQNYPSGIQFGEVATTTGGKLECKVVCHGALPGWNPSTSVKIVETFMKSCLQTAEDRGLVSVAFPALGTGNLGYPKNQVAKMMFSCVDKFGTSHPGTSVCDVRFVVYERDMPTIKAFEEEQRKRQSGEYTDRTTRRLESLNQSGSEAADGWNQDVVGGNKQASVDIGDLTLKIYQGDITQAEVDVIVNGSNRDLDLTRGAVSQAILKKGGRELAKLVEVPSAKKQMKREGLTITPGSNNFNFDYIVHVNMEDTTVDLKAKFKSILENVDDLNKESVALPALGSGVSFSVDKVAEDLCDALINFEKQKSHVKEVHVIIFEQDKLLTFMTAMQKCLQQSQSQGYLSKFKGWLGFGAKHKTPVGQQWKVTKMQKSTLNLVIFAKEKNDIDLAIRSLEESVEGDFKEKVIEDEVLKELRNDQKAKIMKVQEECDVEIELKERIGRIKVKGLIENVSDAMDEIHKIIKDLDRAKQKQQHAKLVADIVQWYFISIEDTGQKLEEYPPEVNLILEQALKNNDPQAFFLDNSGNKYIVDFNTYQEFPEDDPNDTVPVLRKSKLSDSGFDMPSNWVPMDKTENVKIVPLQPSDKEYNDVLGNFQTQMGGNYNSIIKIEKIQNRTLQQQYAAKKKHMDSTNNTGSQNERNLWHGTALDAVDSINTYGFNRSYCGKNAVAYGNGVYFAVNPSYSAQSQYARPDPNGNKRMYMCKVLVGEFTKGQGGMKVPPPKPGAAGGHILYDSVVDNPASPGIFVIFHDTQAYPEYLIVFK